MNSINLKKIALIILIIFVEISFAQNADDTLKSNIQTYTPSKLLNKGQWNIKFFNNLYTETEAKFNVVKAEKARETYFTSTLDIFTGVSENNRLNVGVLLEYRSNAINCKSATSVLGFPSDNSSRNGLSSLAPALKWQPISNVGNFSVQSAFHIPLLDEESDANGVFFDQTAYMFQNRFFYDYTFPSGDWQLFTELSTEYNFGDEDSFCKQYFCIGSRCIYELFS